MIRTRELLDRIVYGLKELPGCESVRFIREYPVSDAENPITGFLAAVCVKSEEIIKSYLGGLVSPSKSGDICRAEAEIRLYAPRSGSGSGLSELVCAILSGLDSADDKHIVVEAKAGPIEFDTNISAVFRSVALTLEFCADGEEDDE